MKKHFGKLILVQSSSEQIFPSNIRSSRPSWFINVQC